MKTLVILYLAVNRVLGTYILVPCLDKISNCDEYDADLYTNPLYRLFREDNCQRFCGLCADYTIEVTSQESTTTSRRTSTDKLTTSDTIIPLETTDNVTENNIEVTTIIVICICGTLLILGAAVLGWWFLFLPATKRPRQNFQPIKT